MKIETIGLDNGEQRILMVFDETKDNTQNVEIDEYLASQE